MDPARDPRISFGSPRAMGKSKSSFFPPNQRDLIQAPPGTLLEATIGAGGGPGSEFERREGMRVEVRAVPVPDADPGPGPGPDLGLGRRCLASISARVLRATSWRRSSLA